MNYRVTPPLWIIRTVLCLLGLFMSQYDTSSASLVDCNNRLGSLVHFLSFLEYLVMIQRNPCFYSKYTSRLQYVPVVYHIMTILRLQPGTNYYRLSLCFRQNCLHRLLVGHNTTVCWLGITLLSVLSIGGLTCGCLVHSQTNNRLSLPLRRSELSTIAGDLASLFIQT